MLKKFGTGEQTMTDSEIVKAKELIKKLEEAYNAYYDTSKGMPYDIDATLRETAICLENSLNEINHLQAENERLKKGWRADVILTADAKAEAYKECIEKAKSEIDSQSHSRSLEASGERFRIHKILDNLLKELVGEQPILNDVKCIDCEYLELELPYAVCSKAYKGIVAPDDSCGKGKLKEMVGE
jgi:hypothetical protein